MGPKKDQLVELIRKRERIQRSITEFSHFVNEVTQRDQLSRADILLIEAKLNRALPKYDEFINVHYQICDLSGEEEHETFKKFEDDYYLSTASSRALIESYAAIEVDKHDMPILSPQSEASDPFCTSKIQLPTMTLAKFNGNPQQWLEFRDTFETLIHNDATLSDIKKFYYLRSVIEGDAKQLIRGIETSAANYTVAWNNLCDRFENKRLLTQNHLSALHNLPNINKESAVQIREMIDKVNQHLRALASLGQPVKYWDTMIIHLMCSKLDPTTIREWEGEQDKCKLPVLETLIQFLRNKANMLESINLKRKEKPEYAKPSNVKEPRHVKSFVVSGLKCNYCKKDHTIYYCHQFLALDIDKRIKATDERNLCRNCLLTGHKSESCERSGCKKCRFKHNSLLHKDKSVVQDDPSENTVTCTSRDSRPDQVILATAMVQAYDRQGQVHQLRALLDPGSQSNFITNRAAKRLELDLLPLNIQVSGINNAGTNVKHRCSLKFGSRFTDYSDKIFCLTVDDITCNLPQSNLHVQGLKLPSGLDLADPGFAVSNGVDLLLGASISWNLLEKGRINLGPNMPAILETKLGWIISGNMPCASQLGNVKCFLSSTQVDIQHDLAKFWELEDIPLSSAIPKSNEEQFCEEHFLKTSRRDVFGRFIVSVPLKDTPDKLGDSKSGAIQRFLSLEKRLNSNQLLKDYYINFIKEYELLGHMTLLDSEPSGVNYFLPHHGVLKESSSTTKLRVVFNGSFKSDSGVSRNDIECVGATVQDDLFSIALRFRGYEIAICADVEKMYRQVSVNPDDRRLQLIVWRENLADALKIYQLNTLTYGTASASFEATRCVKRLAEENLKAYPKAAQVIEKDFYVDDLVTGVNDVHEGKLLCKEIYDIMQSGCFPLRKWKSNVPQVLDLVVDFSPDQHIPIFQTSEATKTLGLVWDCHEDSLQYSISVTNPDVISKRAILSVISKIFDPLGLIGACVITAKILLQELWLLKLDWSSPVPPATARAWLNFCDELDSLSNLRIPRRCSIVNCTQLQLHGFSDASERAYGACLYIRSVDDLGRVETRLLCGKSKVAPIKTVTIPKLELCAALVLAKLTRKVLSSMRLKVDNVFLWSDSEIVLAWLRRETSTLKIFVANRVQQIREYMPDQAWNHVSGKDNPADLISRGLMPSDLVNSKLWWLGPSWLCQPSDSWPERSEPIFIALPELRNNTITLTNVPAVDVIDFSRFSNYLRLLRTMAYVLRFANNSIVCRKNFIGELQAIELQNAEIMLVRIAQEDKFSNEVQQLKRDLPLKSSKLHNLCPFLSKDSLLRVGGRLALSNLDFDSKHQVLPPSNHMLTKLLFRHEHVRLGHAGPQLLLSSIRDRYWPINGKNLAKKTVHECTICYRVKPSNKPPIMGMLPNERVSQAFPFQNTGVDYAGPFLLNDRKGRGAKSRKCYLSVFVCFAIKSVHLELVSDLTTESFLAALRRFVSRRGKPSLIWSDNGTNFVGAQNELRSIVQQLVTNQDQIVGELAIQGITWKFIPANSPHFGGLWEAGVKGAKFHLKRIIGNSRLTFEEFNTVICQIECILNSRPICPLSSDPNDLEALSPGHFLIGRKLSAIPDADLRLIKENRLSRFQLVQQIVQTFWTRWKSEYLQALQVRSKWTKSADKLAVGTLVLIANDNYPPLQWALGRIIETHSGADGTIRVATVRTALGSLKRAVSRLFPLPNQQD